MSLLDVGSEEGSQGGPSDLVGLGRILRATRAVRMLRLLRVLKLKRIVNTVYDMIDSEYTFIVLDLCRLLMFILALNHIIACTWYAIGNSAYGRGARSWLDLAFTDYGSEDDILWKYTTALHWSLTQ